MTCVGNDAARPFAAVIFVEPIAVVIVVVDAGAVCGSGCAIASGPRSIEEAVEIPPVFQAADADVSDVVVDARLGPDFADADATRFILGVCCPLFRFPFLRGVIVFLAAALCKLD